MKLKFLNSFFFLSVALAGTVTLNSCKKVFEVEPETILTNEQTYRNVFDADAAVIGIYGKFMNLSKQYILLNELRADLMTVTANSDVYLKQLNAHSVTPDNPYIDPTPFYEVILNCNDVMKNFDIMKADKKLKDIEYNQRYSDVAAIRSFVYLQLGIHFGTVPYVTDPVAQVSDLRNDSLFPRLPFPQLLAELIKTMESVPFKDVYPSGTTLVTTVDQYFTQKFFIHKQVLLGELHLWNGAYDNSSYRKAAAAFRIVIDTDKFNSNNNNVARTYRIARPDVANGNAVAAVQYVRFRESDINALYESNTEGWRSLFSRGQLNYDGAYNYEWIWVLPFNKSFQPQNPLIDLFSNRGGSYLVKPSKQAIDNWNSQVQVNNFPFDARGGFTYKMIDGQPVIMKFLYYVLDGFSFASVLNGNGRSGEWFLYRAATLHQHYAEAANRDGRYKLAHALINRGIGPTYDVPGVANKTNIMQTFDIAPYDWDAREGDNPNYRSDIYQNVGIRGRAYLTPVPVTNPGDSLIQVEDMTINEGALETAYEGHRWPDLLRVAIRRNNAAYLTSKVGAKLRKEGLGGDAAKIEGKGLSDLYLPFRWK